MIRTVIYQLKKQYGGGPLDIYQKASEVVDMTTGNKTTALNMTRIQRVVCLPEKAIKSVIQSISKISADKAFVYGGTYDTRTRVFLIDHRDAPSLSLTTDDWFVYDNKKYEVKGFDSFEFDSLWVATATQVLGDIGELIIPLRVESLLGIDQETSNG
jgi:hypothetical protein